MAKVATDFMKRHKWTFETPSSELAQYTEEISKSLKDDRKVRSNAKMRFRVLGLTKEQVEVLIPIRPTGKREEGRDTVDKIAQEIVEKDYPSEKIKQISYDLGSSTPNPLRDHEADHSKKEATKIPHITTESNKIQAHRLVLDKFEGVDWPEHFFLEPVQERLDKSDVTGLCIDNYEALDETWRPKKTWYNPKYSWYCTGYSKVKEETGVGEPWPFVSIEKNLLQAKDLLTWIQKAIPEKFPFLRKNKSGIVNVNPINLALAQHGITSSKLRKIGADHASRIHGSRNNSHR
uniref:Uncharacterized protein n=1 Tax=Rhizophagus irregularis (strain DAOM 181602 / DAOM 197198 / MUCL 43194) TaxID=747089 RepID=U9T0L4_RHIID